jgi:NAD dependent epimerase/dehydratase
MKLSGNRVLVTGADGFIGSHLVETLVRKGAKVTALSQYNSLNTWGWLEDISCLGDISVVTGDIRDPHFCLELTKNTDVIFHLAALIPIPYSYRAPDAFVDTNVRGTLNLCQGALANGISKFVHTSTSEVYGTAQYVPMDEKHPLTPQSPYSASKIAADAVALSFHFSFSLGVVIARPFNTYGPRQSARAVIPNIITQIASGKKEICLGDLSPTRDFTFVQDTCRGFLAIAELDCGLGEVFHIGSNQEICIGQLSSLIGEVMRREIRPITVDTRLRPETSEVRRLRCNNQKLKSAASFEPTVSLREGLKVTVQWFLEESNLKKYKPNLYNL